MAHTIHPNCSTIVELIASATPPWLDRVDLQRVLAAFSYLTLTPVRRAPRKPKRPARDKLARALARHQELAAHDRRDSTPAANPAARRAPHPSAQSP